MGVLVTIHMAGNPDRLEEAYMRHRERVWSGTAECQYHVAARMADGFLIADEWASEAGFSSRYAGSALAEAIREVGGTTQVHVATVVDRRTPAGTREEPVGTIDEADPSGRVVPSDS